MKVNIITCIYNIPGESGHDVVGVFKSINDDDLDDAVVFAFHDAINKTIKDWNVIDGKNGWSIEGDNAYCLIQCEIDGIITHSFEFCIDGPHEVKI